MGRHIVLSILFWAVFSYLSLACFEALVFGRLDRAAYVPSAIGCGIGLAIAMRAVSFDRRGS